MSDQNSRHDPPSTPPPRRSSDQSLPPPQSSSDDGTSQHHQNHAPPHLPGLAPFPFFMGGGNGGGAGMIHVFPMPSGAGGAAGIPMVGIAAPDQLGHHHRHDDDQQRATSPNVNGTENGGRMPFPFSGPPGPSSFPFSGPPPGQQPSTATGDGTGVGAGNSTGGGQSTFFMMPMPFPFFASSEPQPDPEAAAELVRSLPTISKGLFDRVNNVVTAEQIQDSKSAANGGMEMEEDELGWKCGICLDGDAGLSETLEEKKQADKNEDQTDKKSEQASKDGDTEMKDQKETNTTNVKCLPCNHLFHESCLTPWFETHHTCPTCRLDLDPMNTLRESRGGRGRPGQGNGGRRAHPYDNGNGRERGPQVEAGDRAEQEATHQFTFIWHMPAPPQPNTQRPAPTPTPAQTQTGNDSHQPSTPGNATLSPPTRTFDIPLRSSPLPMNRSFSAPGTGSPSLPTSTPSPVPPISPMPPSSTAAETSTQGTQRENSRPTPQRRPHFTFAPNPLGMLPFPEQLRDSSQLQGSPPSDSSAPPAATSTTTTPSHPRPALDPSLERRPTLGPNGPASPGPNHIHFIPPWNGFHGLGPHPSPATGQPETEANQRHNHTVFHPHLVVNISGPIFDHPPRTPQAQNNAQAPSSDTANTTTTLAPPPTNRPTTSNRPTERADGNKREKPKKEAVVRESLENWVSTREKALGWRCDNPACVHAPTDEEPVPIDGERENKTISILSELQPYHRPASSKSGAASDGAEGAETFEIHACSHRWHRSCLEMTARSSGWWTPGQGDDEGRVWVRCDMCRKHGWIQAPPSTDASSTSSLVPTVLEASSS